MASELEIDKREIIDTRACYYHENQHKIYRPTNDAMTVIAPFVETVVVKKYVHEDEQPQVNPDVAFDIQMLAYVEIVHQWGEQIADIGETCGSK